MKKTDIKRHLEVYSIFSKRKTTISHAFASALSIPDDYEEAKINTAISILGQDPDSDLLCAYCGKPAETWDHIKAVVIKSAFSGHGHQINNLIPCCKSCNSAKGNKDWIVYLKQKKFDTADRISRITNYINHNYIDANNLLQSDIFKADLEHYSELKEQVFQLLKEGDEQAKLIRNKLKQASIS
jgi:hypothetical protein